MERVIMRYVCRWRNQKSIASKTRENALVDFEFFIVKITDTIKVVDELHCHSVL